MVATIAHPDTDEKIWDATQGTQATLGTLRTLRSRLNAALDWSQLGKRVNDCRFVLNQWTHRPNLSKFVDPKRIAAAGHSYGALTVQALAGQWYSGKSIHHDPRIVAAIAFSPGAISLDSAKSAAGISPAFLCVTGSLDGHVTFGSGEDSMRLGVPVENRIAIYNRLLPGDKHLLVLKGADHMSFAGEPVSATIFSRATGVTWAMDQSNWTKVNMVTKQFWKRYLVGDAGLDGVRFPDSAARVLGDGDRLESK